VTTRTGAKSIRNKLVNEIMHNPVGPWIEANSLYVDQSELRKNLSESTAPELVLFDVGMGAAANAIAALHCARSIGVAARPLRVVSFEKNLDLLHFAVRHACHFDHFLGFEMALNQILTHGSWSDGGISWILRHGDFLESIDIETYRPNIIYFDPYSPNVNNDMWTTRCFQKIRRKCREPSEGGTTLFTYSRATKIRGALLRAGFHVGYGASTGLKTETTAAATDRRLLKSPIGPEWFVRWERSHDRYPFDCLPEEKTLMDEFIQEYGRQRNLDTAMLV
jgi:hypothetical protein